MGGQAWEVTHRAGLTVLALVACLFAAAWAIVWIRSRYRDNEDVAEAEHQMLMQIRDLRREGDLSEEEFRSIKGRLIERIDEAVRQDE